jgi:hypothetical protein
MADLQLQHLNRSRVAALKREEPYLRLDPFSLSRKKWAKAAPGDWIDLGEEPPRLEVARDGRKIAEAFVVPGGIRIVEAREEMERSRDPKRIVLEGRMLVLPTDPLESGAFLALSPHLTERIYLYELGGGLQAVAELLRHPGGYALGILERSHG